ncbi:MAG: sulfatase-like hydrolase/transferase [Planctomycetota bacterium]
MRSASIALLLLLGVSQVSAAGPQAASKTHYNIVVIVADDLGYGETGMMGNREIPTPNIDALAESGIRCTSGYVTASYCSPSRAGLVTGRYQGRFGYDANPTGKRNLLPTSGLPNSEQTFVQSLRDAGYRTGLVGKWHLGGTPAKHPLKRGFESFYGFLHEGHYYVPGPPHEGVYTMLRDTSISNGERVREGNLIRGNYARMSEPPYDQDNPILRGDEKIQEPRYLTDAIAEEAVDFIDKHHDQPFCLMVCFNAVHSPMQASEADVETLRRIRDIQRRIFGGMVLALDRGVGMVTAAIDEQALRRNTLVVFVSDNGGPTAELTSSNAPLRGGKGTLYEGGVRVPMIWSLPGKLPAGRAESRIVTSLDIAATALDLAKLEPNPMADGISLFDWIDDPINGGHEEVFWRMPGGRAAMRIGNWKIVRPRRSERFELYHLESDLGEQRDLSATQREKLKELTNRWRSLNATMQPLK